MGNFKKIGSLFAVMAALLVILSSLPLSPKQARSAGPGLLIIYGHVSAGGAIQDGSGNFTVSHAVPGVYNIAFTASPGFTSAPSVVATPGGPAGPMTTIVETPTTGGVRVRTGGGGSQTDNGFAFIAMGQSATPSSNVNVVFGVINGGRGGYGTPGAMVDRGSGGWTSYLGYGPTYQISFGSGIFTQTPTVVTSLQGSSPVDCLLYDTGSVSQWGATIRSMTNFCTQTQYSWGAINFIAVGTGGLAPANLAIAQGTLSHFGILNPGSTGISAVTNGGGANAPGGITVNFNPNFFAQTPIVITNASTPSYTPVFCAGPYLPSPWSTYVRFTGGSGGGSETCTYGDDRSGYTAHTTLNTAMIAVGYAPIRPPLVSCTAASTNIPFGTSAQFTAQVSGQFPPYTYQWQYPPGSASCGNAAACGTNALNSSLPPGTFTVNVTDNQGSQSGVTTCPGISVALPSVVAASFSSALSQLTFTTTTPVNTPVSANIFVRNVGDASSTMDWSCAVDPSFTLPAGLTVDTSNCRGFGLRGGAPPFP